MGLDRYDALTILFGSIGFFFGSLFAFPIETEYVVPFQALGVVAGVAFAVSAVRSNQKERDDS